MTPDHPNTPSHPKAPVLEAVDALTQALVQVHAAQLQSRRDGWAASTWEREKPAWDQLQARLKDYRRALDIPQR